VQLAGPHVVWAGLEYDHRYSKWAEGLSLAALTQKSEVIILQPGETQTKRCDKALTLDKSKLSAAFIQDSASSTDWNLLAMVVNCWRFIQHAFRCSKEFEG
jgi:hypothetical protein